MRILTLLNISNRQNLGSDSGFIFHSSLFPVCVGRGHEVLVAAPFEIWIDGAEWVPFESGRSKYDVRFRFDWDGYSSLIESTKPDVIFCHQIEQGVGLRALLVTLGLSEKVRLVSYYHYIPALEMRDNAVIWDPALDHDGLAECIFLRVLGSLKASDVFFVTSAYSRDFLHSLAARYRFNFDSKKIVILPPPADPFFELGRPAQFRREPKTVLYSSRLYRQYGTDFLMEIVDYYKGSGVEFIVTDFFRNKSAERRRLDPITEHYRSTLAELENVVVRSDGDDRSIYRDQIIAGANLVLGPYRKNANWSMSMIDAFMLGVPAIGPNFASFPEFVPSSLLYEDKESAVTLIDRLLSDETFWIESSLACRKSSWRFSAEKIADIFLNTLEAL
jgi:glycosyltransferase involved in cell wall biosynthesis